MSYLIWFAHKEKQQLNRLIVIIHEFQLSEFQKEQISIATLRSFIHLLSPV